VKVFPRSECGGTLVELLIAMVILSIILEQLRRESESARRNRWHELETIKAEYDALPTDRDKFLESNIALAKLKGALSDYKELLLSGCDAEKALGEKR